MPELDITFGAFIENHDIDQFLRHRGPVFHRWLPDGEKDAITLSFPDENASVRLWFERRGYVDGSGFIKYDHKRKEVDDSVVPRQGILEAGAIFGRVKLSQVAEAEFEAVTNNIVGSNEYEALGKRIVKNIVDPTLNRAAVLLRDTYGQYWISPPSNFDSRVCSLGQHCHRRGMKWNALNKLEGDFMPNEKKTETVTIVVGPDDYSEYMTQESWATLGEILATDYTPSLSTTIATRSRRLLDEGRLEHALIEIVTALEIAIEEFVRDKLRNDTNLIGITQSFWQLNLPARISLVSAMADVEPENIEATLRIVAARNDFVHEGKHPPDTVEEEFPALLTIFRALSGAPALKFPSASSGNSLMATPEDWDK